MAKQDQVKNGKSFEYALANEYFLFLANKGINVQIIKDEAYNLDKTYYDSIFHSEQEGFCSAARATIDTMIKIEPGLASLKGDSDPLIIRLAKDSEGQKGDVRDIIFSRPAIKWEIGFSAKNNNDAVKHSRLSNVIVNRGKGSDVVIMSLEEYESLRETIYIMSQPNLVDAIQQGDKDIKSGNYEIINMPGHRL